MFNETRVTLNNPLFGLVKSIISRWALLQVSKLQQEIRHELEPCTHIYRPISGLPCKHDILRRLNDKSNPRLRPEDFHRHWFYNYTDFPGPQQLSAFHHVQDPDMNTRHMKTRRVAPDSSTLRGPTAAELEDKRLLHLARLQQAPEAGRREQEVILVPDEDEVILVPATQLPPMMPPT